MGFFANIIQDSRRAITTDVRAPVVMNMPIYTPAADAIVSEVAPPSDFSHAVEGSQLRVQPEILQQANDASLDVTQPNRVGTPQSVAKPRDQAMGAAPSKKTSALKAKNSTTQPVDMEKPNLVSSLPAVPVQMAGKMPRVKNERREARPAEPSNERGGARTTTKSRNVITSGDVIDAPSNTEHTPVQVTTDVTDVRDVYHTPPPLPRGAEHMSIRDSEVIDVAQHVSAVEATDVHYLSTATPVPAMPGRPTREVADKQHAERSAGVNVPRVQIGQVNIVVEGPSDSKRQPVNIPSGNDLASRTFLRSL